MLLNTDEFATLSKVMRPAGDVRIFTQKGAALALREAAPHTKLHAVIKGIRATLVQHRAVAANHRGLTLLCPSHEKRIGVTVAALGLGNPLTTLGG